MIRTVAKKIWILALLGVAAAAFLMLGGTRPNSVAAAPGTTVAPLLSCPNIDGSADNRVTVPDILGVVQVYFHDWPNTNYQYLLDLAEPYNPETGAGGQERINDILAVVGRYFDTCPLVDTQVAQATQWAMDTDPVTPGLQPVPVIEDSAALASLGYIGGSTDVPGQGRHYVKLINWDGNFYPAAPEGLVYSNGPEDPTTARGSCHDNIDNGGDGTADTNGRWVGNPLVQVLPPDPDCQTYRLAAQLYVVNGDTVGWLEDPLSSTPGSCWDGIDNGGDGLIDAADGDCGVGNPVGSPLDDINIDPIAQNCGPNGCSWATDEGWHLHYRLCTIHIGTPNAVAIPLQDLGPSPPHNYQTDCNNLQASNAVCPVSPGCGGTGLHTYNARVGWMGHLWNHIPNANQVPDANSTMNGRFSDCYPDYGVWTAYNCPQ